MKSYKGVVFYVDILGIGFLTSGHATLSIEDYTDCGIKIDENHNHHYFSAKLLINFRKILNNIRKKNKKISVAQLSDSAFIWGESILDVLDAGRRCMWDCVEAGILCRGGTSYGQIIEPDNVNTSIGRFVLGEAVTKAVNLEKAGKGCRIFADDEIAFQVGKIKRFKHEPFVPRKNLLDFNVASEFRWYMFPEAINSRGRLQNSSSAITKGLMKLTASLLYCPKFMWNAKSSDGRIQLAASIETISSCISDLIKNNNLVFSIEHTLRNLDSNRSDNIKERTLEIWGNDYTCAGK